MCLAILWHCKVKGENSIFFVFVKICIAITRFKFRSSHQRCSTKNAVLQYSHENTSIGVSLMCWSLFFLMNIARFLRKPILKNICKQLFLVSYYFQKQHLFFYYYLLDLLDYYLWIKNGIITPCHKQLCFCNRSTKFINTDLFIISCFHSSNISNNFLEFLQSVSVT